MHTTCCRCILVALYGFGKGNFDFSQRSSCHLRVRREPIHAAMVRNEQPVITVDCFDLKVDRSWHLSRAAIRAGGRALTVLGVVFPAGQQGSPKAEK